MASDFDATRFIEALTLHQPALEAFCYANVARRGDAREVLQATCVKLWQKAADWDPGTPFLPWAFAVARFVALSHLRDNMRDRYFHNGKMEQYHGFCTDVFFSEAKRFILESKAKEKPFFIYLSTNAPHGPMLCPEKYWEHYVDQIHALPAYKDRARTFAKTSAIFYGMIANIDENVGGLRSFLADNGLDQNTVIVFAGDNGSAQGSEIFNAGMRGKKAKLEEGGHRVPLFFHWPAAGVDKGKDVDALTAHIDLLPTFIDWFGLEGFGAEYPFDGRSLVPLIEGQETDWTGRTIYTDLQGKSPRMWKWSTVMKDQWRLMDGKVLHDIRKDPGQKIDVAKQFPEVVEQLRAEYEQWFAGFEPDWKKMARITVGNPEENPAHLTAFDCHRDKSSVPWNQSSIRLGKPAIGLWEIHVESAGTYRISLRRWPTELDKEIRGTVPKGSTVPGSQAPREHEGVSIKAVGAGLKIAGQALKKEVPPDAKSITFELQLDAGDTQLEPWFDLGEPIKDGDREHDRVVAYYVAVEKVPRSEEEGPERERSTR